MMVYLAPIIKFPQTYGRNRIERGLFRFSMPSGMPLSEQPDSNLLAIEIHVKRSNPLLGNSFMQIQFYEFDKELNTGKATADKLSEQF